MLKNEPLVIKRRGEDGSRIITVRLREDTLAELDRIAAESNYSRNELINIILAHGVKNIEIESGSSGGENSVFPSRTKSICPAVFAGQILFLCAYVIYFFPKNSSK